MAPTPIHSREHHAEQLKALSTLRVPGNRSGAEIAELPTPTAS